MPINAVTYEPDKINRKEQSKEDIKKIIILNKIDKIIRREKTLVIINDNHRSTPSHKILKILSEISPNHQISVIVIATGSHDTLSTKEINNILKGTDKLLNADVIVHDSTSNDLQSVGTTTRGTEIKINPILFRFDQILAINSVEPHYFAGFTGGIKSIIPGLAAKTTIEQNHSWAMHEAIRPRNLLDNPLQQDLLEAGAFVKCKKYAIQMVCIEDQIIFVSAGELVKAFQEAVKISDQLFSKKLEESVDVILSIIYPPLNQTLYQAQKGIENTKHILKMGGEMILIASCNNGIGNDAFFKTLSRYESIDEVLRNLRQDNYSFGDHKAQKFALLAKDHTITIVGELSEEKCKKVFARKLSSKGLESYLRELSSQGKSIAVVLDSGSLVTYI